MDEIVKKHPELYHYTSFAGLESILTNNQLRLTYIRSLNDREEMTAFKPRFVKIIHKSVLSIIEEKCKASAQFSRLVQKNGGIKTASKKISSELTNLIYLQLTGKGLLPPAVHPFIFSFCTPDNENIAKHGLLSQWRGYGINGGYSVVFDTKRLHEQIEADALIQPAEYLGSLGDVAYSHLSDDEIADNFSTNLQDLTNHIVNYIKYNELEHLQNTLIPLVRCACLYKHWGFFEEQEVRLVIVPFHEEAVKQSKANPNANIQAMKIDSFRRAGSTTDIPCIFLLNNQRTIKKKHLPITRIIIGPNVNQDQHKREVHALLKKLGIKHIKVTKSEIPYI